MAKQLQLTFQSISTHITDWIDRVMSALIWVIVFIVTALFIWIIADLIWQGLSHITWQFLTEAPSDVGRAGGIAPIIVSTALILVVCMAVSLPIGLCTAIFLAEFSKSNAWLGIIIRRSLDVLASVPSIVFGLFGNAFFCIYLGLGFSILSGGLTLACMVLPILIRTTEEGFRAVPDQYRHAAAALGISKTAMIGRVLLPAATPGLVVGLILGIGRALAETAALLFTSGYVDRMPSSLMDSGRALSIHIYDLAMNVPGGVERANATSLVLISLLLIINFLTFWMAERWLHQRVMKV